MSALGEFEFDFTPAPTPRAITDQNAWRDRHDPKVWFFCERPESPPDRNATVHDCCAACLIGLRAAMTAGVIPSTDVHGLDVLAHLTERLGSLGPAPRSAVTP